MDDDPSVCPVCGAEGYSCSPGMLGSEGVRIVRLADQKERPMYTLTERTYVNSDSTKVVDEGSTEAAWLLGIEGEEISDETAERLGLVGAPEAPKKSKKGATAQVEAPEATADVAAPEDV